MTADIELLPLYAELQGHPKLEIIKHYARANVAHAVEKWRESVDRAFDDIRELRHEVAAKDAEIEALRAELRLAWSAVASKAGWEWRKQAKQAEAKVEQLAEALRHQRWCRTCGEDGWDSCDEGRAAIDLLRDHDQEVGNE